MNNWALYALIEQPYRYAGCVLRAQDCKTLPAHRDDSICHPLPLSGTAVQNGSGAVRGNPLLFATTRNTAPTWSLTLHTPRHDPELMATPKVRAACAASVGVLAPELPCTLDLGAGNPLPTASADSSPTSTATTAISPHITSRPLEDGKDARPSSAGSAGSTVSAASAGLSGSTNSAGPGSSKAKANGGSPSGVRVTKGLKRARMTLKTATELSQSEKEDLFSLWKANMGHYAHLDYTDAGKWEEMYDADARYLIIRRSTSTSPSSSPLSRTLKLASVSSRSGGKEKDKEKDKDKENGGGDGKEKERRDEGAGEGRKRRRMRRRSKDQDHGELLGFASFRFDTEETMSPQDAEVVYW